MSSSGLRYDRYRVNGRDEWLMRIGPDAGAPILFVPPLFEEMNRTRALLAGVMRALGGEGFRCTLPDLPGTGESERPLETCAWEDWQAAVRAADTPALVASFRGGALLDVVVEASAWWRFGPVNGASLLRDLERAASAAGGANSRPPSSRAPLDFARDERASGKVEHLAGYPVTAEFSAALRSIELAQIAPCRTVRLASDPKPADAKLDGPALWRRSEPANSSELTDAIASDINVWAHQCGIC